MGSYSSSAAINCKLHPLRLRPISGAMAVMRGAVPATKKCSSRSVRKDAAQARIYAYWCRGLPDRAASKSQASDSSSSRLSSRTTATDVAPPPDGVSSCELAGQGLADKPLIIDGRSRAQLGGACHQSPSRARRADRAQWSSKRRELLPWRVNPGQEVAMGRIPERRGGETTKRLGG